MKFVKNNYKQIINDVVVENIGSDNPVSIFMAGSPGAGKTEFSKHLLTIWFKGMPIVRIDPDEIRGMLPQYTGGNSYVFQRAVSLATDKVLDFVFKHNIHFLLDGTLASETVAKKNMDRCIKKGRFIQINYVYQEPKVAWRFTQAREKVEGRKITREIFENGLKNAYDTVVKIKKEYENSVVNIITRNIENNEYEYVFDVQDIDKYIKRV